MARTSEPTEFRYSAKLLFQWRVDVDGDSGVMRLCEERLVLIHAPDARKALALAKRKGKSAAFKCRNDFGDPLFFEFVGVLDLLQLGAECDEDEVWYDIVRRKLPMERAADILPHESELCAIRNERRWPTVWPSKRPRVRPPRPRSAG